jgi:hypothetical protein
MHHCYENRMEYLVVNQGASKKRLTARDGRTLRRCDQRTVVRAWFKGSGRLNLLRCHGRMMGRSGVAAKPPCVEIRNRVIYPVVGDAVGPVHGSYVIQTDRMQQAPAMSPIKQNGVV